MTLIVWTNILGHPCIVFTSIYVIYILQAVLCEYICMACSVYGDGRTLPITNISTVSSLHVCEVLMTTSGMDLEKDLEKDIIFVNV